MEEVDFIDDDYNRDVASCNFGDMLTDNERNEKYYAALKIAISKRKREGKSTHVLDIGTGTGLLSMMAARLGADSVVACEMFTPVAHCAKTIISRNKLSDKIRVINKRSTELSVGPDGDLSLKADILVTEVFDTELIGEGALETFNHAHNNLLQPDAIVIPSFGTMYCQVVESECLLRWNRLEDWVDEDKPIVTVPKDIANCPGPAALFDIQMSQLQPDQFRALSEPVGIFSFDFMQRKANFLFDEMTTLRIKAAQKGRAQMVFMWWDLKMDEDGVVPLSCAPVWAHPDGKNGQANVGNPAANIPWRDHWMQAVYFLPNHLDLETDQDFTLRAWHDEFSLWFAVCKCPENSCSCPPEKMPLCQCGLHFLVSRTRLAAMNDPLRKSFFIRSAKKLISDTKNFIVLGDFSLLGFALSALGAQNVHILIEDDSTWMKRVYQSFFTPETSVKIYSDMDTLASDVAHYKNLCVISEPFINSSLLPWENLRYHILKDKLLQKLPQSCENLVFPEKVTIKGMCVCFDDLWKMRQPLVECQGFDISPFEELVSEARRGGCGNPEPHPLWEYPCRAISEEVELTTVNLQVAANPGTLSSIRKIKCWPSEHEIKGLSVWVEYEGCGSVISTGPLKPPVIGEYVVWDPCERQGVLFYRALHSEPSELTCHVSFSPKQCELNVAVSCENIK